MDAGLNTQNTVQSPIQAQLQQAVSQSQQLAAQSEATDRPSQSVILSISTALSTDTVVLDVVGEDFTRASSMLEASNAGLEAIEALIKEAQVTVAPKASSTAGTTNERLFVNAELQQLQQQIDTIASNTNYKNVALLNNNGVETIRVANSIADVTATEDTAFSYTIAANSFSDPEGDDINYYVTQTEGTALPDWLSFDEATRTFSGTPTTSDIGDISITVSATDSGSGLSVADSFTLTVAANTGLTVTGTNGNDTLNGGAANDTISGLEGDDVINAGAGQDIITVAANPGTVPASNLPVTDNLVLRLDAGNTADIAAHPGAVTLIQDQSSFNNDIEDDQGTVFSGSDTINDINSLTFDGSSFLNVDNSSDINTGYFDQRSVFVAFETGADVNNRQVVYEQGGRTNGYNIYIDSGRVYVGAWRGNGGTFSLFHSEIIDPNSTNVVGFVFDSTVDDHFTGYLNGSSIGTTANTAAQSNHSGAIGIGGRHNATRYHDSSANGDGHEFTGEIGELLNYRDALTSTEANDLQDYLTDRFMGSNLADTVAGGTGQDTLNLTTNGVDITLDASSTVTGVETISLSGNHNDHEFTVTDDIFTAGTGIENNELTIDSSGSNNALTVDSSAVSGGNSLELILGAGNDTITGGANVNTKVSFSAAGAMTIDLDAGTATGDGTDVLTNIRNVSGSAYADTITGSSGDDSLQGAGGDDSLTGGAGNDTIEGGAGTDSAIFSGNIADYTITNNGDGSYSVTDDRVGAPEGTDLIRDQVEMLRFADGTVQLSYNTAPELDIPTGPFAIAEDSENGTAIGTINATDTDSADTLNYTITTGNGAGVFALDSSTGALTIADNATLDSATTPFYDLTIRATDDGTGTLYDERTVRINVTQPLATSPAANLQSHTANVRNLGIPLHGATAKLLFEDGLLDVSNQDRAKLTELTLSNALEKIQQMKVANDAAKFSLDTAKVIAERDSISFQQAQNSLLYPSAYDNKKQEAEMTIKQAVLIPSFADIEEQLTKSLLA